MECFVKVSTEFQLLSCDGIDPLSTGKNQYHSKNYIQRFIKEKFWYIMIE